jgi:hypothetical protein
VEGGWQCTGFGHGVINEYLEEGKGACLAISKNKYNEIMKQRREDDKYWNSLSAAEKEIIPKHSWGETDMPNLWGQWREWEGPYYYRPDRKDFKVPATGFRHPREDNPNPNNL